MFKLIVDLLFALLGVLSVIALILYMIFPIVELFYFGILILPMSGTYMILFTDVTNEIFKIEREITKYE